MILYIIMYNTLTIFKFIDLTLGFLATDLSPTTNLLSGRTFTYFVMLSILKTDLRCEFKDIYDTHEQMKTRLKPTKIIKLYVVVKMRHKLLYSFS